MGKRLERATCTLEEQARRLKHLEQGVVYRSQNIYTFKFRNDYYTSGKKRRKRYSMDDCSWELDASKGSLWKFSQVVLGKVRKLYRELR